MPGWFLTEGIFERAGNLSSLSQIVGPALLAAAISVVIDTGLIFGIWQLFRGASGLTKRSQSS